MYNSFKYLVGGAALVLATSALAGGPEVAPAPVVDNSGFYINANGGLALLAGQYNDAILGDWYQTAGWNAGGALGYHWTNWRVELAANYFQHAARNNNVFNPFGFGVQNLQLWDVMVNGYYDFDMGNNNLIPYLGLGLGYAGTREGINVFGFGTRNFTQSYFAAQGIVGVDYKIDENWRVGVAGHLIGLFGSRNNNNFILANGNANIFRRGYGLESQINLSLSYFF